MDFGFIDEISHRSVRVLCPSTEKWGLRKIATRPPFVFDTKKEKNTYSKCLTL